jgi:putative transposase
LRNDFLHKLSKAIIDENQVIVVEDLNVKGMLKNEYLSKSISDSGFGKFLRYLEYKADWYGRTLIIVDRFYPSSKLCNVMWI